MTGLKVESLQNTKQKRQNVLVFWKDIVFIETVIVAANFHNAIEHFGKPIRPAVIHAHVHNPHTIHTYTSQLVSWSLTSPFSTNMATSETKGQGWRAPI